MTDITGALVLPSDVELVPVADLPESVRKRLAYSEGDVAITRQHSRTPSKVISAGTAALLQYFRTEATIVEAVLRYCLAEHENPRDVLDAALPILQQVILARLLVAAGTADAEVTQISLAPGARADGLSIMSCAHILEDTELYQARDERGALVALKILRPNAATAGAALIAREATILRHLNGSVAPRLRATGVHEQRPYLVMDWVPGVASTEAAAELRQEGATGRRDLLALCLRIAHAYAQLHGQGVLHADVHPSNILVDGPGRVFLIDFGLARALGPAPAVSEPQPGGVAFFYRPEYAAALRAGRFPPPASELGEQYQVAALLYHLLTGLYYLDFALEEAEMLRQICEETPVRFEQQGLPSWPPVEDTLARALHKDPAERFPGMSEFAAALERVLEEDAAVPAAGTDAATAIQAPLGREAQGLLDEFLARVDWTGPLLATGLPQPPFASLHSGAAGIAYALYRIACLRGGPRLLALADTWAERAACYFGDHTGFYSPAAGLTEELAGHVSPFHTPSGVLAVRTLIAQARGDRLGLEMGLAGFVAAASQPCDNLDLALGRAGLLVVGALLYEALGDRALAERSGLLALGEATMADIWHALDAYPPILQAAQLPNLGIAHGWAGLLYASLRWSQATGAPLPPGADTRLGELAGCAEYINRGIRWPWELGRPEAGYMPGWCNGSAGYVFLWSLAGQMTGEARYEDLADAAAWNAWEDEAEVANLCCGLAGRAYALLNRYRRTGSQAWLRKAQTLANRAAVNIRQFPVQEDQGLENSLFRGETGVALLLADVANPDSAAMPFFEAEGWPAQP